MQAWMHVILNALELTNGKLSMPWIWKTENDACSATDESRILDALELISVEMCITYKEH